MERECRMYGREEKCIWNSDGKIRWREIIGRPRRWWENNIKMVLGGICWSGVD
jgi:hypothetical protein